MVTYPSRYISQRCHRVAYVEWMGVFGLGLFCCLLAIIGVGGAAAVAANYRRHNNDPL
jgi:hypothetical protein